MMKPTKHTIDVSEFGIKRISGSITVWAQGSSSMPSNREPKYRYPITSEKGIVSRTSESHVYIAANDIVINGLAVGFNIWIDKIGDNWYRNDLYFAGKASDSARSKVANKLTKAIAEWLTARPEVSARGEYEKLFELSVNTRNDIAAAEQKLKALKRLHEEVKKSLTAQALLLLDYVIDEPKLNKGTIEECNHS
jgi:hypothetical protein